MAAGHGTRLGDEWSDTPKAMVPILGRPMLYYSMNAFDDSGLIDSFVVTAPPDPHDEIGKFEEQIKIWGFSRPAAVIAGGATRAESVRNALFELSDDPPDLVMIHDCARPCLTADWVKMLVDSAGDGEGAALAHPATDTLRLVMDQRIAIELNRSVVACIETPQLFPYQRIMELHNLIDISVSSDVPSDDSTLFTTVGDTVRVVYHGGCNLKVTYSDDIGAAEGILFGRGWQDASEDED